METPNSAAQAKNHVLKIRNEKGLTETGQTRNHNVADLESALKLLSEQLYESPNHYLLELIQNADDNSYENGVIAGLTISWEKDSLRIDCNETGFSPKNVDAICRIGQSTKAGPSHSAGYVGEKGIGFKSVFKVADVVWVASRHYSFKFDKNQQLGMIAPIWVSPEAFPGGIRYGYTSFHMQLSASANKQNLMEEIHSLQPTLLIFLRRLRRVDIKITGLPGWNLETTLSRKDESGVDTKISTLSQGNKSLRYLIIKKIVPDLPPEPSRPGISKTEVVLAFPFDRGEPYLTPQHVYAFLPIRHYGFEFLMQADFVLVASREDLDISSEWNHALVKAFENTIAEAVRRFVMGPVEEIALRYTWIRYLPQVPLPLNVFRRMKLDLFERLKKEAIIESQTGGLAAPISLFYVPEKYRSPTGLPMTFTPKNASKYVSQKYKDSDFKYLKVLGVREMAVSDFLGDLSLSSTGEDTSQDFQKKRRQYHSDLAKILVPLLSDPMYIEQVRNLPIIRLRGGRWVSAIELPIFFPGDTDDWSIPEGVNAMVVQSHHAKASKINLLYSELGVERLSQTQIGQLIITTHESPNFSPSALSRKELISQAVFLFRARLKNLGNDSLWFAAEDNQYYNGSQLYHHSEGKHTASSLLGPRSAFPFLHKDYLSAVTGSKQNWLSWLYESMDIWSIPRLVRSWPSDGFEMSPHFRFILSNCSSKDVLLLLRNNWQHYSKWLEEDKSKEVQTPVFMESMSKLKEWLRSMPVECLGRVSQELCMTFLPLQNLPREASTFIPLLDVPEPQDKRWQFLKHLGVGVENDVVLYLRWLEELADDGNNQPSNSLMTYLLEQIQARYADNRVLVESVFTTKEVIYVPPEKNGRTPFWTSLQLCLWKGPRFLRNYVCLEPYYPLNGKLFCDFLELRSCSIYHLIMEAKRFQPDFNLRYIASVFLALNKYMKLDEPVTQIQSLHDYNVFPVRTSDQLTPIGYDGLVRGQSTAEWFIADRNHLAASFTGLVPLLAFDTDTTIEMESFLKALRFNNRMLSQVANVIAVTEDPVELDPRYMKELRSKANFFVRLIPDSKPERSQIVQQLRNLEVYAAQGVQQRWSVKMGNKCIQGRPSPGRVAFHSESTMLQIYLLKKNLTSNPPSSYFELAEQLANFCGTEEKNKWLSILAIIENDHKIITQQFERAGIRNLKTDEEHELFDYGTHEDGPAGVPHSTSLEDDSGREIFDRVTKVAEGYVTRKKIRIFAHQGVPRPKVPKGPNNTKAGKELVQSSNRDRDDDTSDYYLASSSDESSASGSANDSEPEQNGKPGKLAVITSGKLPRRKKRRVRFDENIAAAGELFVSGLLKVVLGDEYKAKYHWTSKRRNRVLKDLSPFEGDECSNANFTLPDIKGRFTKFLVNQGYPGATTWLKRPPIYRLEVKGTEGGLESYFSISNEQMRRARKFSFIPHDGSDSTRSPPSNVCILVRVFNIEGDPEVSFYVDPWLRYLENSLRLEADGMFVGRIRLRAED